MELSEDDRFMLRCFALFSASISFPGGTVAQIITRAKQFEDYYLVPADDEVMED